MLPPPFAGLARRSDFPHAWGLAHVLPCISCTGVPAVYTGASRHQLLRGGWLLFRIWSRWNRAASGWTVPAPRSSAAVLITS